MLIINVYRNNSEYNTINKQLDFITIVRGVLRDETDILYPIISFSLNSPPNFNYVYIPEFKRYYFVCDIKNVASGLFELSLSFDALETYKDTILSANGLIERNEFISNPLISDSYQCYENGVDFEYIYGPKIRTIGIDPLNDPVFILNAPFISIKVEED